MGKRPKFDISVTVKELTNLPHVSGYCWIRWYIKDSPKPDARGKTEKYPIREHKATFEKYTIHLSSSIRINSKTNVLREMVAVFDVLWSHSSSSDKVTLGKVEVNLSEFVNQDPHPTRFLLKNSKTNSTLYLTILMKQIDGTKTFEVYVI